MIVFTEPGDTPESITHRYVGSNDAAFSARLQQANLNSFAWKLANESGYYAANRAVWLPLDEDFYPHTRDRIIREFDWMYTDKRAALAKLQKAGVDHRTLVGAYKITLYANQEAGIDAPDNSIHPVHLNLDQKTNDTSTNGIGMAVGLGMDTLDRTTDLRRNRLDKLTANLKDVKHSLKKLAAASDPVAKQKALTDYHTARDALYRQTNHELLQYKLQNHPLLRTNPAKMKAKANKLQRKGWEIYDEHVMKDVEHMTNALKWTGRGIFAINIFSDSFDVFDTYEKGGDWQKEAGKEGVKLGIDSLVIGSTDIVLAALSLTPIGWLAIITVGIIEAGEIMYTEHLVNRALS